MNILYVLSHITKSLQWQWFAEEMKNRGINQTYVIIDSQYGTGCHLYDDLLAMGVKAYMLPYRYKIEHAYNILKTVSIIKKNKIDIVHTSLPYGNAIGQAAAWLCGIRNRISTCENASWADDFGSKKQRVIDRLTYLTSKKVIAVADSAKEYLKERYGLKEDKLFTIYHGLKESEYENVTQDKVKQIKNELRLDQEEFIVGVVSRYEYWKGHEFINKAAAILKQRNRHHGIKILIFGSMGSYYQTAMKQIVDLNVGDIVQYKGFSADPVSLFRTFNVHLHVPINKYVENCGINIIEGMISGAPQILTKSGYAWQSAEHMKNAYVVDYQNAEDIADAIEFMKNNRETARRLGEQAKTDAIATYGLKAKVDKHISLYQEVENVFDTPLDLQLSK
jgi:glycosyltransferase involved in cell wall biosynthesis